MVYPYNGLLQNKGKNVLVIDTCSNAGEPNTAVTLGQGSRYRRVHAVEILEKARQSNNDRNWARHGRGVGGDDGNGMGWWLPRCICLSKFITYTLEMGFLGGSDS